MRIVLANTSVYRWSSSNGMYFRGYIIPDSGEHALKGLDALNLFAGVTTIDQFRKVLTKVQGVFSIIIDNESIRCAAVDISRSLPLFYSKNGQYLSDSADAIREKLGIRREQVDDYLMAVMTAESFLIGNDTAYAEIGQLDMGQFIAFGDGSPMPAYYFYHINQVVDRPVDNIKKELTQAAYNVFDRIKKAIDGRPVVLSMSGGYDSRFVACMLKNVGVTDISGSSYGIAGVFEAVQAKKNAKALGIRWTFVEYTDELVKKCMGLR